MTSDYANKAVWIIGASSGIGRALAVELSRRGAALILSARDEDALQKLNGELGGKHAVFRTDVTDPASIEAAVTTLPARLDSVIFLAGQYKPMKLDALDMKVTGEIVAANMSGAFNLIHAILPKMLQQGRGQIALCASVTGYRGLPNSQPYSATKAGMINLAESLRAETRKRGLDVRVIDPGFVRTRLTDQNDFKMPFIIEPEGRRTCHCRWPGWQTLRHQFSQAAGDPSQIAQATSPMALLWIGQRMKFVSGLWPLLLTFLATACAQLGVTAANLPTHFDGVTITRDIAFGPDDWEKLDIYDVTGTDTARPKDVVVFYYGGRWETGKKRGLPLCRRGARQAGLHRRHPRLPQISAGALPRLRAGRGQIAGLDVAAYRPVRRQRRPAARVGPFGGARILRRC